jgi:hypothetical protein
MIHPWVQLCVHGCAVSIFQTSSSSILHGAIFSFATCAIGYYCCVIRKYDLFFRLIARWVGRKVTERESLFKELLSGAPLSQVGRETFVQLLDFESLFENSETARFALLQAMYAGHVVSNNGMICLILGTRIRSRCRNMKDSTRRCWRSTAAKSISTSTTPV